MGLETIWRVEAIKNSFANVTILGPLPDAPRFTVGLAEKWIEGNCGRCFPN
jgi:hypothetical protein